MPPRYPRVHPRHSRAPAIPCYRLIIRVITPYIVAPPPRHARPFFAFPSPSVSGLPSGCSAPPEPSRTRPAVRCRWLGAVPYNLRTCILLTSVRFTGAVHRCAPNARGRSWVSCQRTGLCGGSHGGAAQVPTLARSQRLLTLQSRAAPAADGCSVCLWSAARRGGARGGAGACKARSGEWLA